MKWTRAVHHLESLAQTCAEMADRDPAIFALRVTQVWAVGDVLGEPRDLEWVTAALCVDLPVEEVPWWGEPRGAQHWANATRLAKNPIVAWWRSARAPVWNHRIVQPALLWDVDGGVRDDTLAALAQGRGGDVRTAAPSDQELGARLFEEMAVSVHALRTATRTYDDRRWAPGKIEPVADSLWRAADGYLDVLAAMPVLTP